eukprot:9469596-Pyramimonas_sp.AAC.1
MKKYDVIRHMSTERTTMMTTWTRPTSKNSTVLAAVTKIKMRMTFGRTNLERTAITIQATAKTLTVMAMMTMMTMI